MNSTRDKKETALLTILSVLIVSLMLNVYQSVSIEKYKLEIGKSSCDNIETIRYRNESNLSILDNAVSSKSLTNEELLNLFKNYDEIATAEIELWEHYLKLINSSVIFKKNKKVEALEISRSDILINLEEYIYSFLKRELFEGSETIELEGKELNEFTTLRNVAYDINKYFTDFYTKYLSEKEGELRTNAMIKREYWIDIINGIEEITNKYVNYEFINK